MPVKSEAVCEVCHIKNKFHGGLPPEGFLKVTWFGRAKKSRYYFCSWDCVMKHAAEYEPTRELRLNLGEQAESD